MNKKNIALGIVLTFLLLAVHLALIDDYGLTWDFHHHFFAGMHLLKQPITPEMTANLPFTEPDPRGTYKLPFGPLMSIAPVATYLVFFKWLGILAFDNAYNLSIIVGGVAGVFILYLFLLEAFGLTTALAGFAFLALLPRYWGDLHNNMKDVPQAAAFTLAIWMFWRLARYKSLKALILASLAFAVAFNTKVNTIVVPAIAGVWILIQQVVNPKRQSAAWRMVLGYFLLAPLLAFLLWSLFWNDPLGQLLYIPRFFIDNTKNIEILINGLWYCSGVNVPWWYPLWYLSITTPLPTLLFFLIGLTVLVGQIKKRPVASLLLLWFVLPLMRYAFPRMGVIDGIRHFEEVIYPLTAIAAVGATSVLHRMKNIKVITMTTLIIFILLIKGVISYHPFQISYYNELVGGTRGAFGKYDIDYWGGPQKKAMQWLNENAPKDSKIHVVMAADVAGRYLRPDLLVTLNKYGYDESDFVVFLNRQSFFYRFFYSYEYLLRHTPTETIRVQGAPLVWIFDNRTQNITERQAPWWQGEDPCIIPYWRGGKP
jgi:hypothetical protein